MSNTKHSNTTRSMYRQYVEGMTPSRIGREFQDDSSRLRQLFQDASGEKVDTETGKKIWFPKRALRFFTSLGQRLNPTRRLVFGGSVTGFFAHYLVASPLADILLPASVFGIFVILVLELLEKQDARQEIDLAREIQLGLLPPAHVRHRELDFVSYASTANDVGGDYVDIVDTGKGSYLIIADVAGKGLSAALYMVRLQALVHLLIKKFNPSPKQLFLELNDYIKSSKKDKTFVTACAAFFPNEGDHFLFARAGHNAPLIYTRERDASMELRSSGLALGIAPTDTLDEHLKEATISFQTGDSLLFYTDGLTEARNHVREEYGIHRLQSLVDIYGSLNASTIIRKIEVSLEHFIDNGKLEDDITFTCVRRLARKTEQVEDAEVTDSE